LKSIAKGLEMPKGWRGFKTGNLLAILKALDPGEVGPMTCTEICAYLALRKSQVQPLLQQLYTKKPQAGRRVHISGWVRDGEGERDYPRPVYALGDLPDKPKPRPKSGTARTQAYRDKKRKLRQTQFVFNLGLRGLRTGSNKQASV
jgi:hypothetical protein